MGGAIVLALLGVAGCFTSNSPEAPTSGRPAGGPLPGRETAEPTVPTQSIESVRVTKSTVRAAAKAGARWPAFVEDVYEQAGMVWVLTTISGDGPPPHAMRAMCRTLTRRLAELPTFPGFSIRATDGTAVVTKIDADAPCTPSGGRP